MVVIQIIFQLFFSPLIICIASPHLHFNDKLLPQIINDQIRTFLISGSRFHIIIASAVNDRLHIEHKIPASVFLKEPFITITVNVVKMNDKFFKDKLHI